MELHLSQGCQLYPFPSLNNQSPPSPTFPLLHLYPLPPLTGRQESGPEALQLPRSQISV